MKAFVIILALVSIVLVIAAVQDLVSEKARYPEVLPRAERDVSTPTTVQTREANQQKEETIASIAPEPSLPSASRQLNMGQSRSISTQGSFDENSDGYSWRAASFEYRRSFCAAAAAKAQNIKPGVTGTFIFEAVQEFYTTEDRSLLRKPLFDIMAISMWAYK